MGQTQATTATWSIDDWAYGTGQNIVSMDEVLEETSKLPAKYFGGAAIEKDASMHQMQHDLLSFDETLKKIFRRKKKKNKQSKKEEASQEEYYYEYEDGTPAPLPEEGEEEGEPTDQTTNYLAPIFADENQTLSTDSVGNVNQKLFWRCTYCTAENKITETACRRCGQAETKL